MSLERLQLQEKKSGAADLVAAVFAAFFARRAAGRADRRVGLGARREGLLPQAGEETARGHPCSSLMCSAWNGAVNFLLASRAGKRRACNPCHLRALKKLPGENVRRLDLEVGQVGDHGGQRSLDRFYLWALLCNFCEREPQVCRSCDVKPHGEENPPHGPPALEEHSEGRVLNSAL